MCACDGTYLLLFVYQLRGHDDEVLDVCFDFTGQYIATASADGKQKYSGDVQSLKYCNLTIYFGIFEANHALIVISISMLLFVCSFKVYKLTYVLIHYILLILDRFNYKYNANSERRLERSMISF